MNQAEIDEIFRLRAVGVSQRVIAATFGVNQSTVSLILRGVSKARRKLSTRPLVGAPPPGHKICGLCCQTRSHDVFGKDKLKQDGRAAWCRACTREYNKSPRAKAQRAAWRKRPNVRARILKQNHTRGAFAGHLRRRCGITFEQFGALIQLQCGLCAGCSVPLTKEGKDGLHVDHDHVTQAVRGLLCSPCNRALGLVRDSLDTLRALAGYVDNPTSKAIKAEPALSEYWAKGAETVYDAGGNLAVWQEKAA